MKDLQAASRLVDVEEKAEIGGTFSLSPSSRGHNTHQPLNPEASALANTQQSNQSFTFDNNLDSGIDNNTSLPPTYFATNYSTPTMVDHEMCDIAKALALANHHDAMRKVEGLVAQRDFTITQGKQSIRRLDGIVYALSVSLGISLALLIIALGHQTFKSHNN